MGGTFNPIHVGHLFLAEQARVCFQLQSVIFLPTGHPGYPKEEQPIEAKHRLQMTSLAINSHPNFYLSTWETEQDQPTFTIHSLKAFRKWYPEEEYELFFITGADAVVDILKWKEPEIILSLAQFIAGTRPQVSLEEFQKTLAHSRQAESRIHLMQIPLLEISSCLIRSYVRGGKSIRYLVTEPVESYINKYQLYAMKKEGSVIE